jgi:hypothetical protein
MGRDAAVTYEQVQAAADAQQSSGEKPTVRLTRQMLGNVGSMGTISKFLQQWRATQATTLGSPRMLPPSLQQAIFSFSDQEAAHLRTEMAADLDHANNELAILANDNVLRNEVVERQRIEIAEFASSAAQAEGRHAQLSSENRELRNEVETQRRTVEQVRIELAQEKFQSARLPGLEMELKRSRSDTESQRQARAVAEQVAAVAAAEQAQCLARFVDIKEDLDIARERQAALERRVDELLSMVESEKNLRTEAEKCLAILNAREPSPQRARKHQKQKDVGARQPDL